MKQRLPIILSAVSCALMVLCVFELADQEAEIERLRDQVSDSLYAVERTVNSVPDTVRRAMEEEASLLSGSGWEYGDMDLETGTASLLCTVTPKEYRAGITRAVLTLRDREYPMAEENGRFSAQAEIPLFEDSSGARVVFSEGDVRRTEEQDWGFSPRHSLLPYVYGFYSGRSDLWNAA